MSKQQTAVEWLIDWMGKNQYFIGNDLLDAYKQAKEMEKEQIKKAYLDGVFDRTIHTTNDNDLVPYHTLCSCNPANGGNGVCGCVLGNTMVNRKNYNPLRNWSSTDINTKY